MKKITGYEMKVADNGAKYVTLESVPGTEIGISLFNEKLGPCLNYGLSVFHTCRHDCECYMKTDTNGNKVPGDCYGFHNCCSFPGNKAIYANNFKFIMSHSYDEILAEFQRHIDAHPELKDFRHFEVGDIPFMWYVGLMCDLSRRNPSVRFWAYTKKYDFVNGYFDRYGIETKPENLAINFSHWRNSDGSFLPMENPYNFPTAEFIPAGHENEIQENTHICPCSDPDYIGFCITCDHCCGSLKHGSHMALLEHSTSASRERDKKLSAARAAHKAEKETLLNEIKAERAAIRKEIMKARKAAAK